MPGCRETDLSERDFEHKGTEGRTERSRAVGKRT